MKKGHEQNLVVRPASLQCSLYQEEGPNLPFQPLGKKVRRTTASRGRRPFYYLNGSIQTSGVQGLGESEGRVAYSQPAQYLGKITTGSTTENDEVYVFLKGSPKKPGTGYQKIAFLQVCLRRCQPLYPRPDRILGKDPPLRE